jgi:hypothetical protein
MNFSKAFAGLVISTLLFACGGQEEKKETPAADTAAKKEAITENAPKGLDTIEIYHFKGAEPYINSEYLKNASEAEKALLAYYCYFFNTSCKDSKHCVLTDALGLGEQNSKAHKELVLKWFTDNETIQLAREGGRITPEGCKNMAWYEEIKLVKKGDLVIVRYHSAWKTDNQEGKGRGTDEYQLEANRIKVIGRQHEDI